MEDQSTTRIKEIKKYLIQSLDDFGPLRAIKQSKGVLEKKVFNTLKENHDNILTDKIHAQYEVRELIFKIDEISSIPQKILSLTIFRRFESCHILVHEKGKTIGLNYSINLNKENIVKNISVQNFNNIFSFIKKSKLKNFNLSATFKEDLDIVGTFIAKDIDLKNYSAIILISRNSFLPPSESDIDNFNLVTNYLYPLLNKLLEKESHEKRKELYIKAIKKFPEKINVKDEQRVIFSNEKSKNESENVNLIVFPLDHIGRLKMELSNMAQDSISAEIYHSQRITLLGELLNTLQHELSNPLFGLGLASSLLIDNHPHEDSNELLENISQNAIRSQTIIKNFSNLYNGDQQTLRPINLFQIVDETITLTKSESKEIPKFIKCSEKLNKESLIINTNPTYLTQILFNLILNAVQAIKMASRSPHLHNIVISISEIPKGYIVEVIDDGPGISENISELVFNPFFTTKESGTGLGLSICKNLAKQINAEIDFKNNYPLPGATFSIKLFK